VKIGLQLPDFTWPGGPATLGADLATIARTADDAGFDFLAVMDHFFQIGVVGPPENDMLEAYTTLGYLAAHTTRAKLLTMVTGAVYRHPGILAKQVSTLDVPVRRAGLARHRRRVERGGVARPRRTLPTAGGALRAARGDAADRVPDVQRERGAVPGKAFHAGPAAQPSGAAESSRTRPS
jgi:hypothetical protein